MLSHDNKPDIHTTNPLTLSLKLRHAFGNKPFNPEDDVQTEPFVPTPMGPQGPIKPSEPAPEKED